VLFNLSFNANTELLHFSEYWIDQFIYYGCTDKTMGVDAGDSPTIAFKCVVSEPTGRYETPNENETWPSCLKRTTTVKPREQAIYRLTVAPGPLQLVPSAVIVSCDTFIMCVTNVYAMRERFQELLHMGHQTQHKNIHLAF
jgi:hypothetical protein